MRRGRRKGASKDRVFGCDLLEHLAASSQEIPQVLRCCSEFIEEYGIVDGIYRLSGVSSNTQKLRAEFDIEGVPDLSKDVYRQDIHCVSSLCKAYFRELPNPLLTYQLYDKFADAVAIQLEEERLVKIREVLKDLPVPHYRTLEYLMRHLVKMATFASETNMHSRNLAIVWAPNLLRSKDIEATGLNGTAAFMEVRVQSIVVEFILTHVNQLFPLPGQVPERRKSLPSPSALSSQEDQFFRVIPLNVPSALSPGNGPPAMRPYHAIIEGTDKRKGSLKGRKWKSIFNLGGRLQDPRRKNKSTCKEKVKIGLRPAKSMDSLSSVPYTPEGTRQHPSTTPLAETSPTLGRAAGSAGGLVGGAVGGTGSGYAVTYRRGGGACVSVVSGGGVQGTYSRLDSGENTVDSLTPPPRSPGMTSRAERRAGMHISGPFSVTVPLHITSSLALGMLQGGAQREEGGAQREEGGAHREEVGTQREEGVANRENGSSHMEEDGEGRREEERQCDVSRECGAEEEKREGNRLEEDRKTDSGEESRKEHFSVETTEPAQAASPKDEHDYMDMRRAFPPEEQDSQLPLDFQDTFGFLDLMDSSAYSQVNEFSVEPPCYEEEDNDDDEESGYPGDPPSLPTPERTPQLPQIHRPLTSDPHGHSCKSHSLPYKSRPFLPALSSSSSEEDDEDEEEGSDEEENRLFYSLPSSLQFKAAKDNEAGTDTHPTVGLPAQPGQDTNASINCSISTRSSVNVFGQSEGELDQSEDMDWLVALARPRQIGEHDATEEEDSLELKKQMEEEGETPTNSASGERDCTVALTNAIYGLGCGEGESAFAESEEEEEQGERDNADELTEPEERDHAAEFTKPKERDCTAGHSATQAKEKDHEELKEKDDTAEHSATEQSERDHTAEFTQPRESDHTAEHSGSEPKETDHAAEFTVPKERDHAAEHTEPKKRVHAAENCSTQPKERDCTASTTDAKEDEELKERDPTAEHRATDAKEKDHKVEHTEPKERDHAVEHCGPEAKKEDHAAQLSITDHRDRLHKNTGPGRTAGNHHRSPEDPEDCRGDSVNRTELAAELIECNVSPEPCSLPLPEPPWELLTCAHLDQEPPGTPGEQEHTCRKEWEESQKEGEGKEEGERGETEEEQERGREGETEREQEGGRKGRRENNVESHNQLDVHEKEERKGKGEESQERKETSGEVEEGRGERDCRLEKENIQKNEEQMNLRERDEEQSEGGEEDREQGATQGRNAREKLRKEGRSPGIGPGVGRTLVYSRQAMPKLYQAKAVPVVPPKPQNCKLTALTLRQQRERERGREEERDREGKKDREQAQRRDGENEEQKGREAEREREKERDMGGENEGELENWGDDGRRVEKEVKRNSGVSMCFDVAVARATEKRGREREKGGNDGQTENRKGAEKD